MKPTVMAKQMMDFAGCVNSMMCCPKCGGGCNDKSYRPCMRRGAKRGLPKTQLPWSRNSVETRALLCGIESSLCDWRYNWSGSRAQKTWKGKVPFGAARWPECETSRKVTTAADHQRRGCGTRQAGRLLQYGLGAVAQGSKKVGEQICSKLSVGCLGAHGSGASPCSLGGRELGLCPGPKAQSQSNPARKNAGHGVVC